MAVKGSKYRICLVQPRLEGPYPPLGLGYLASYLEKYGHYDYEVKIVDGNCERDILNAVKSFGPYLIGFSALSPQIREAVNLSRQLRLALPETLQILGGIHATAEPEKTLEKGSFDALVTGEGERTFQELVDSIISDNYEIKDLNKIPGIAFSRNGEFYYTGVREEIKNLDTLPFPKRELFNMRYYLSQYLLIRGLVGNRISTVHTSRGCPFNCTFCSCGIVFKKVRYFTCAYVIEELKQLVANFNVKAIFFTDDTFILDKKRVWDFSEALIKSGLNRKIKWEVQGRANLIDWEDLPLLKLMKRAGCVQVDYGFEVGDDAILKFLKKEFVSVELNRRAIEITKKAGLKVLGTFMLGVPGETDTQMVKTERFIKENLKDIDFFQVFIATPYPGSELYRICLREKIVQGDYIAQLANEDEGKGIKIYSNSVSYECLIKVLANLDKLMLTKISILAKLNWFIYNLIHFPRDTLRRLLCFFSKHRPRARTTGLENLKILLSGQLLVGRTETLENYLRERCAILGVIGTDNIFAPQKLSRFSLYRNKVTAKSFALPSLRIKKQNLFYPFFLILNFCLQFFSIFLAGIFSDFRYDLFIGIGCFPAFAGVILKKIKKVKHCVYYCIDYFPPQKHVSFNYFLLKILLWADSYCVKCADLTWHISPLIADARSKYRGLEAKNYNHIIVPLCFDESFLHFKPIGKIERNTLAFVGSSGFFHGLDLLFIGLPLIIKELPGVKIKIFGVGPWDEFRKKVEEAGMSQYFTIEGYIEKNEDLLEKLSSCAAGVALYIPTEGNPTLYADPGKPKLYAFCGLPSVITKTPFVAREIEQRRAGIAIDYTKEDLSRAVLKILKDNGELEAYRKNAFEFANDYTSGKVYDSAFRKTLNFIFNAQ